MQKAINKFEMLKKQAKRAKLVENKTDVESDETKAWHQLHELAGQWVNRVSRASPRGREAQSDAS